MFYELLTFFIPIIILSLTSFYYQDVFKMRMINVFNYYFLVIEIVINLNMSMLSILNFQTKFWWSLSIATIVTLLLLIGLYFIWDAFDSKDEKEFDYMEHVVLLGTILLVSLGYLGYRTSLLI